MRRTTTLALLALLLAGCPGPTDWLDNGLMVRDGLELHVEGFPVTVAVADENDPAAFAPILLANPNLPIIHTDINTNRVQVITNQSIDAHITDLLAAIAGLPDRAASGKEHSSNGKD